MVSGWLSRKQSTHLLLCKWLQWVNWSKKLIIFHAAIFFTIDSSRMKKSKTTKKKKNNHKNMQKMLFWWGSRLDHLAMKSVASCRLFKCSLAPGGGGEWPRMRAGNVLLSAHVWWAGQFPGGWGRAGALDALEEVGVAVTSSAAVTESPNSGPESHGAALGHPTLQHKQRPSGSTSKQ